MAEKIPAGGPEPLASANKIFPICRALLLAAGVAMFAYHMISTQRLFFNNFEHQNIHLVFALVIVFLGSILRPENKWVMVFLTLAIVCSIASTAYVHIFLEHLEETVGMPENLDMVVGVILIILVIESTRQAWGLTLPIVGTVFILYFFFGHLIPGPLHHREFDFSYVISYLCTGLTGVYGTFMSISANQIFLFVVFGALLGGIKVNDCLNEIGKFAGRFSQAGPAYTAVISSSLVGMVSGAAVSNVAITGAFTIPYMKRVGYKTEMAGAIEAAASTGGQLMPPVMGAAAFLMAFFVGIPYATIMTAAIIPALLFYLGVFACVQFLAVSENIQVDAEKPDVKLIIRRAPLFFIPLFVIITLLLMRFSPMLSAFWAIITAVVLSYIDKDTRMSFKELLGCLAKGAAVGAKIGVSLGVVGMMAQVLITTGLGSKIANLVQIFSGGNLAIALIITMFVSIILGCGVPPAAAYSLVALVVAPTLVNMGVDKISAHFFAFYFAIISAVTPPVALGALAGAGIAEANYFKTSFHAFKLSIAGFIVPYLIVFNPMMTLRGESSVTMLLTVIAVPCAILTLSAFIYNAFLVKMDVLERLLSLMSAICLFLFCTLLQNNYIVFLVGISFFVILLARQISKKKIFNKIGIMNS
jgi:TRAP transporter 4TM/12TM fusion protein